MLTPLLVTLVLLNQAPAAPDGPITTLIAPPDTAGVPGHVVEFAQEHVAEQARAKGLKVIRMKDFIRKLPASKRRALLRCKRTELRCLTALGDAAKSEVVLVAELLQRMDGYRVGTKIYKTADGGLVAEHLIPGVREDGMLDAITQSMDVVVPQVIAQLREPPPTPPGPGTPTGEGPGTPTGEGTGTPTGEGTGTPTGEGTGTPTGEGTGTPTGPGTGTPTGPGTGTPTGEGTGTPTGPGTGTPDPEPSKHPWAWAPAAGGAVFAGVGTVFYLQAKEKHRMLEAEGSVDAQLDGQKIASEGRRAQNLSRVAFGLAAAGVATSVVLYLLPAKETPSVSPAVTVGPGGGMVGLVGTLP